MLTSKVRELGKQLQTTHLARESPTPASVNKSAPPAKTERANDDAIVPERRASSGSSDALAAACQKALTLIGTSLKPTARARKLAELDAFYRQRGRSPSP